MTGVSAFLLGFMAGVACPFIYFWYDAKQTMRNHRAKKEV